MAGQAQIAGAGTSAVVVTQSSAKAVIDWRQFSIEAGASVRFAQPGRASVTLNRVTGAATSQIDGLLTANGQVWLLNPNGVLIGGSGRVNAGGFVASTHALSAGDFMAGRYTFTDAASAGAAVVNAGRIEANEGGYAVLAGRQVGNAGLIEARLGTVALGAAHAFTLDLAGDRLLSFAVAGDLAGESAMVANRGLLRADGGRVLMTARAAADVVDSVINNRGLVQARSIRLVEGAIVLDGGDGGTVEAAGRLDASGLGEGETGGRIAVLGDTVVVGDGTQLDARGTAGGGEVLVGGGWQGESILGRPSAVRTAVAPTAVLDASATTSGHGGTVVAWSDVTNADSQTIALGTFRADGGQTSGDGGRIETSGHVLITDGARGSAAANDGKAGTWLFDPYDIEIVTGNVVNLTNPGFESGLDGWTVFGDFSEFGSVTTTSLGVPAEAPAGSAKDGERFLFAASGRANNEVGVEQSFTGTVGQTVSVFGRFFTDDTFIDFGDGQALNDFARIELVGPHGTTLLFEHDVATFGAFAFPSTSSWQQREPFVLSRSGNYTLRAYVFADGDPSGTSYLGFEVATSGFGGVFKTQGGSQGWVADTPGSKVYAEKINALLSAGTNVHISTTGDGRGTQQGNITVNAAILKTGAAPAALKLEADNSIFVNEAIGSTGGRLDVELLAKGVAGVVKVDAPINLWPSDTGAGDIRLAASAIDIGTGGSLRGRDLQLTGDRVDAQGNATVSGQNSIIIAPRTADRAIRLGQGPNQDPVLALGPVLKKLDVPTLVIGAADGTGTIEIASSFNDQSLAAATTDIVIQAPGAGGRIDIRGRIDVPTGSEWRLIAGDEIQLENPARFDIAGALELIAGQRFTNRAGANALTTEGAGRWLVYSAAPELSTFDGLASGRTALWGRSFAVAAAGDIEATDNRYAFGLAPQLTLTVRAKTKTYGQLVSFGPDDFEVSGLVDAAAFGNVFAQDVTAGSASLASAGALARADVGIYAITLATGSLIAPDGYGSTQVAGGSLTVNPKALGVSLTGAVRKTYDGTNAATIDAANFALDVGDLLEGDDVTVAGASGTYADKNAGTGKSVSVQSLQLAGEKAGNYTIGGSITGNVGQIDAKAISAGASVASKVYDGTTTATGNLVLSDLVAGDAVTATAGFAFANKDAGTGKAVRVSNATLAGADAANYTVVLPTDATADITPKALGASLLAQNKTYDGNTATGGTATLTGAIVGDDVSAAGATFTFADRNAGNDKIVEVVGLTLAGADAGNYSLAAPSTTVADILQKMLSANATAASKTYDGTTATTGQLTLSGVIAGDTVATANTQFAFADRNAGTGKLVDLSGTTLTGADAGNYRLAAPITTVADILRKVADITATANGKVYDGTTAGSGVLSLAGIVAGDAVGTTGTQFTFADANAGTNVGVAVSGTLLTGADGNNYQLGAAPTLSATITPRVLTASLTGAVQRTYDATRTATLAASNLSLAGFVAGQGAAVAPPAASFATSNVGANLLVTASLTPTSFVAGVGTSLSNYVLPTAADGAIGTITPATLTYVATPVSRPRGDPDPLLTGTVTGFVGNDTLVSATGGTLAFTADVGPNSPVGSYAINGGGLAATNYNFVQAAGNASAFRVNEAMGTFSTVTTLVQRSTASAVPTSNAVAGQAAAAAGGRPNSPPGLVGNAVGPPGIAPPPPAPLPPPQLTLPPPITVTGVTGVAATEAPPPPPSGPPVEATPPSPVTEAAPTPSDGADQSDVVLAEADAPGEEGSDATSEKRQLATTAVVAPNVGVELTAPPGQPEVPGADQSFSGSGNPSNWSS